MKFELAPYNHGLGDNELLDDLRGVAAKLGKNFVTKDEYDKLGRLCSSTLQNRFGTWCRANELAGLRKIRHYDATAQDCVDDLKSVAAKLGKIDISCTEYIAHGQYNLTLIARRCGSFRAAIERAGLAPTPNSSVRFTDEQLFENLEMLWESLGRQPRRDDYVKPLSRVSYTPYARRFGSYRKALEAFVASFDGERGSTAERTAETGNANFAPNLAPARHKTSRSVSWRARFLVMRRDDFKCRICGASPALKPGIVLVVDHVTPWDSGGETVMENLQTLCEPCNSGKSNLSLSPQ